MIKNEPYYLDRLANAETLSEAVEIAQTLERLGSNEAYPPIAAQLTRLVVKKAPRVDQPAQPIKETHDPNEWSMTPPGWG